MYRIIFRYRWAAMLFVLLVVAGAMQLVGTGKGDGHLAKVERDVTEQRENFEAATGQSLDGEPVEIIEEEAEPEDWYGAQEDLIDRAEGIDPTPDLPDMDDGGSASEPQIRIVDSSDMEG